MNTCSLFGIYIIKYSIPSTPPWNAPSSFSSLWHFWGFLLLCCPDLQVSKRWYAQRLNYIPLSCSISALGMSWFCFALVSRQFRIHKVIQIHFYQPKVIIQFPLRCAGSSFGTAAAMDGWLDMEWNLNSMLITRSFRSFRWFYSSAASSSRSSCRCCCSFSDQVFYLIRFNSFSRSNWNSYLSECLLSGSEDRDGSCKRFSPRVYRQHPKWRVIKCRRYIVANLARARNYDGIFGFVKKF